MQVQLLPGVPKIMMPFIKDRVFQICEQKTFWGEIEESTDQKVVIKWDSLGNLGQSYTTFHGKHSGLVRVRDCWEVKF
jgi:hypothetical protein